MNFGNFMFASVSYGPFLDMKMTFGLGQVTTINIFKL